MIYLFFLNRTHEREESSAQTPRLFLFDSHPEIQAYNVQHSNIQYPISNILFKCLYQIRKVRGPLFSGIESTSVCMSFRMDF
jgi:hypothetical protein